MLNREVFYEDPGKRDLPNLGVARVAHPDSDQEWQKLQFELSHFVSDGEYGHGLDRVLSTYLAYIGQSKQPAAWVSGFYGSGKSHFLRVLEHLWVDTVLPDGSSARGITEVPQNVADALLELTSTAKRAGGLWVAAGTLGAGSSASVRLAFMRVLFEAAGLPSQYGPACLVLWLKQNGIYDEVVAQVEQAGKSMDSELTHMYVAQALPEALLAARPGFAGSAAEVRSLFKAQYPNKTDIDETEMLQVMREVLELQSQRPGDLPLSLVILDELQQYIGDDSARTLTADALVQAVSSEFGGQVAIVAAGQSAMGGTPALMKLKDRFTVAVQLSDQDVETVIRQVVLRKAPDKSPELHAVLDRDSGEIGSHLGGTAIAASSADSTILLADYPILPTRRRFWEHVLRAVDRGGAHSQLRTQLRMAHDAVRSVADKPVGTVVGADFIYGNQSTGMLQSGVLTKDVYETLEGLRGGRNLRFRAAACVFMIDQLKQAQSDIGVLATDTIIADLLVEDLDTPSAAFRNDVKETLAALHAEGFLVQSDGAYAVTSKVPQEWLRDFNSRRNVIMGDSGRLAGSRDDALRAAVNAAVGTLTIQQGKSRTPRKLRVEFGTVPPTFDGAGVPVWVRTEWDVKEKAAHQEADALGTASPVVTVFLPMLEADALRAELARQLAAQETIDFRPAPTTDEGIQAKNAIESERDMAKAKVAGIVARVMEGASVFLGGGAPASGAPLRALVEQAATSALVRLYGQFDVADHPASAWQSVAKRAQEGGTDVLVPVGHHGPPEQHPVVKEVLASLKGSGTKGTDVRAKFMGVGYGWPQDAVDAALLALVQAGLVRADLNGTTVTLKQLNLAQVGKAVYRPEEIVPTAIQKIAVRGLISRLVPEMSPAGGEEVPGATRFLQHLIELAARAGGPAPVPAPPDAAPIRQLQQASGNALVIEVFDAQEQVEELCQEWSRREKAISQRLPRWDKAQRLIMHAQQLPIADELAPRLEAVKADRLLLDEPDPVLPIVKDLEEALRAALVTEKAAFDAAREKGMAELSGDEMFRQLPEERRKAIVAKCGLSALDMPKVDTEDSLLKELDATSLSQWADKTAGLESRFERARQIAAAELEPTKVTLKPPKALLKTKPEADAYVESLRDEILKQIEAGHPVVI